MGLTLGRLAAPLIALLWSGVGGAAPVPGDAAAFLERHWERPLARQGKAPRASIPGEYDLDPARCGQCHPAQLSDWRTSLHGKAMGPGVYGQLLAMDADDREGHQDCLRCHAPLAEQADALVADLRSGSRMGLHRDGLACAACHVRSHRYFGPPRRDGSAPTAGSAKLPHGGFTASDAFRDSRFCAACHQFEADGYAINGKLVENTYAEWAASRHAREGRHCQSCHMPDRRHLWRGIHDPEMTRAGVALESDAQFGHGRVSATVALRNTNTGHNFPTYLTPQVYIDMWQERADGSRIAGTERRDAIGWGVTLDLAEELYDTRIAPDAEHRFRYDESLRRDAAALVARVRVEPDAFYAGFFRAWLPDAAVGDGAALIRQALADAEASPYDLFTRRWPVRR